MWTLLVPIAPYEAISLSQLSTLERVRGKATTLVQEFLASCEREGLSCFVRSMCLKPYETPGFACESQLDLSILWPKSIISATSSSTDATPSVTCLTVSGKSSKTRRAMTHQSSRNSSSRSKLAKTQA